MFNRKANLKEDSLYKTTKVLSNCINEIKELSSYIDEIKIEQAKMRLIYDLDTETAYEVKEHLVEFSFIESYPVIANVPMENRRKDYYVFSFNRHEYGVFTVDVKTNSNKHFVKIESVIKLKGEN